MEKKKKYKVIPIRGKYLKIRDIFFFFWQEDKRYIHQRGEKIKTLVAPIVSLLIIKNTESPRIPRDVDPPKTIKSFPSRDRCAATSHRRVLRGLQYAANSSLLMSATCRSGVGADNFPPFALCLCGDSSFESLCGSELKQ